MATVPGRAVVLQGLPACQGFNGRRLGSGRFFFAAPKQSEVLNENMLKPSDTCHISEFSKLTSVTRGTATERCLSFRGRVEQLVSGETPLGSKTG